MHKGHTVKKCKVGCNYYRGFTTDHQLQCAWSPKSQLTNHQQTSKEVTRYDNVFSSNKQHS